MVREAVSAVIDGEDPGADLAGVVRHQATCPDCAAWSRTWQRAGARARMVSAEPVPDLAELIVAAVVADRTVARRRRHLPTRLALVAVAVAQLVATTPFLLFGRDQLAPVHLARELGSFGVAVSLGLLVAAAWPSLAAGSLPVLAAAGGLLAVTAGLDIVSGRAEAFAELPHLLPAVGVFLLCRLVMTWSPPDPSDRRTTNGDTWRAALHTMRRGLRHGHGRAQVPSVRILHNMRTRPGLVRTLRRLGAVTVLAAVLGGAAAAPASAHATLETSNPQAGSVVATGPAALSLHFDESVSVLPGSLKVVDPAGHRVDQGQVNHQAGRGSDVVVGLRSKLPRGSYLVAWRVVSADSHPVSGAFTFSIGVVSATASAASLETSSSKPVGWVLGAGRFLTYAGLALLLGGVVFLLLCWPTGWRVTRARGAIIVGWAALLVGTVVELAGKGPYDAGQGLSGIARPALVDEVLATPYGSALRIRLVTLLLIAGWWALRRRVATSHAVWRTAAGVLAVVLLYSFARAGHANAGSHRVLALASDGAHLVAMSTWLGGLAMLAVVLLARATAEDSQALAAAPQAIARFSRLAAASVLVLVVTGTYQSWRQVGSFDALAATTYGRVLLVKLGLVTTVLAAAALSRQWVRGQFRPVPVVHASVESDISTAAEQPAPVADRAALSVLRKSVAAEATLALVVLVVTAALVAVQPARTAYRPSVAENLRLGPITMQVSAVPDGDKHMDLHLYAFDRSGAPANPPEVTARLDLPSRDIGPLPMDLLRGGSGHWIGTVAVPIRGDWRLRVSARTTDIDIYTSDVTLPVR